MSEQIPPPWGDDPLSKFFSEAEHNDRVTSLRFIKIYALLRRVHATFLRVGEAIEKDNRDELLVSRFLIIRTHSAFLAAIRLAMSGQIPETYPVLRLAIEQAWYALHIANHPERATIWLCRNDNEVSREKCKDEFKIGNVRSTHESLDPSTAAKMQALYGEVIDLGAHPNQLSVMSAMSRREIEKEIYLGVGILQPEPAPMILALKRAVEVAVGALKIFYLIFPERFKLMGIDAETEALVKELNTIFIVYAAEMRKQHN